MTLKSHLLTKVQQSTIVLILLISTMVNSTVINFGNIYDLRVIFDQCTAVAKVALSFGCAKQSKNLEWCLISKYLGDSGTIYKRTDCNTDGKIVKHIKIGHLFVDPKIPLSPKTMLNKIPRVIDN